VLPIRSRTLSVSMGMYSKKQTTDLQTYGPAEHYQSRHQMDIPPIGPLV
jgi:hypothetical protein